MALSELAAARLDLFVLDCALEGCNSVGIAVAKALAVASEHPGVETHIDCCNAREATEALTYIYSHKVQQREHAHWNSTEAGLELPNGSIVVVMLDGKKVVPK